MNSAHDPARELERALGDPFDDRNLTSFAGAVVADDREEFPQAATDALHRLGFHHWLVPRRWGGKLGSYEQLFALVQCVARRDLSVDIAHGTALLAANPIWLWGSAQQRGRVAELILGGAFGSFGMSEATHGSDLLAGELRADRSDGGWRLHGEKWPIGNATRGRFVTLFARTAAAGGPRGFTLFLVDKDAIDGATISALPKVKTLGGRGHDLSGIRFDGTPIGEQAVLGREGLGVDQTLRALQLTRALISGLSLGAGDTALRVASSWASLRILYGRPAAELPPVRELLATAFVDLLTCDCVATTACRAASIAPDRLSLWSSVAKYWVPVTVENLLRDVSVVLGARHYLREGIGAGIFQKMLRDHAIASVFEGTTLVNLHIVADQLPAIADASTGRSDEALLPTLFDLRRPAPEWNPESAGLTLHNRGSDEIFHGIDSSIAAARRLERTPELDAALELLSRERRRLIADVVALGDQQRVLAETVDGYDLARRYCAIAAAASALHVWAHSHAGLDEFLRRGEWLVLSIERQLGAPPSRALVPRIQAELAQRCADRRLLSIAGLPFGH
jgi:alkylation response protein AidB-like acyl-CoA dehydrogenase